MKLLKILTLVTLFISSGVQAKIKLNNIEFKKESGTGRIILNLADVIVKTPELEVRDGFIQVSMPDTIVWPKIEKKISVNSNLDTTLTAYQFDNDNVRFRAYVPGAKSLNPQKVNLKIKNKEIHVEFPVIQTEMTKASPAPSRSPALDPSSKVAKAEKQDDSYLNKLLADKENLNIELEKRAATDTTETNTKTDAVSMVQASTDKVQSFSLAGYAAKFVAFLAIFIVVMYGAVHLMKKGVLGKNKLGFLNSTKTIEVLSSTFVAPKKSLILVRAHKQVFLVGSSENGLQLISEVNDVPGMIKESERSVAGDNFDTNYSEIEKTEKEFNLKSVIDEPAVQEEVKERVKLSDQIKSKVKNLKPLQ